MVYVSLVVGDVVVSEWSPPPAPESLQVIKNRKSVGGHLILERKDAPSYSLYQVRLVRLASRVLPGARVTYRDVCYRIMVLLIECILSWAMSWQ